MAEGSQKQLYHGSEFIIEEPLFHGGKRHNDYGYAFYTTEDRELACEWAVGKDHDGYVNRYLLDMDGLTVLNLEDPSCSALNWLEILIENRTFSFRSPLAAEAARYLKEHFHTDYEEKDIIIGYRADDSYFRFAQDFLSGTISYEQLTRSLRFGLLGEQIAVRSRRATERLRFQGAEPVPCRQWYPAKERRENKARKDYHDLDKNRFQRGELYMIRILDEEIRPGDPRLRV